jgi:serine acetyltransferase
MIKDGVSIGANTTVIAGVTIGKYAMVGAGSVVTKNVPDYGLVFGNPAFLKGFVCECCAKLSKVRKENNKVILNCSRCGKNIIIDSKVYKEVEG